MSPLPPGPRLPRALQAVGWTQRPLPWLEKCQRRYGDTFTLRIRHYGDWVILADPDDVKKVFTAGRAVGVDVANPLLGPLLGPRSVMLLEEPEHMTRRKLMLPSFHGQAVQADAEMMGTVAREEIERWPVGEPFALWPRMQDITLDVVMRAVFGPDASSSRLQPLRDRLRGLTTWMNEPRNLAMLAFLGPGWVTRSRGYREAMGAVEEAVMEEVRRRKADPEGGSMGVVSMLVQARYEDGSPMSDRDLRDELVTLLSDGPTSSTARLDLRAAAAQPGQTPEAASGPRRGRRGLPRRGREGDAAAAPAGAGGRPQPAGADVGWAATTCRRGRRSPPAST